MWIDEKPRSEYPSKQKKNVEKDRGIVLEDRWRATEVIAKLSGLIYGGPGLFFSIMTMNLFSQPYLFASSCIKKGMTPLTQGPQLSDLAACDFFFFPRMKGHRFNDVEKMMKRTNQDLGVIQTNEFEQCFQQLNQQLLRCIKLNEVYIEGVTRCFEKKNFFNHYTRFFLRPMYSCNLL